MLRLASSQLARTIDLRGLGDQSDGYRMYSKGADAVMEKRLASGGGELLKKTKDDIEQFSKEVRRLSLREQPRERVSDTLLC